MPNKKPKGKRRVEITFQIPDDVASVDEIERIILEQWREQLPKIRESLRKADSSPNAGRAEPDE